MMALRGHPLGDPLPALESSLNGTVGDILRELGLPGRVSVKVEPRRCKVEVLDSEECSGPCGRLIAILEDLAGTLAYGRMDEERRSELERLKDEVRRAYEECARCSGAMLVYGEYYCDSQTIVLYPKCLLAEPCLDTSYLTSRMLETLAHELIHAGQFQGWTTIGTVPVVVHLKCGSPRHVQARSFPYRYRPHEAEAIEKMGRVARLLKRTSRGTNLERTTRDIVELYAGQYRRMLIG